MDYTEVHIYVCYKIATIKYLKHFCKQKKTETYM